jgi:N-acetylmuramoyl-L-alanine amidase
MYGRKERHMSVSVWRMVLIGLVLLVTSLHSAASKPIGVGTWIYDLNGAIHSGPRGQAGTVSSLVQELKTAGISFVIVKTVADIGGPFPANDRGLDAFRSNCQSAGIAIWQYARVRNNGHCREVVATVKEQLLTPGLVGFYLDMEEPVDPSGIADTVKEITSYRDAHCPRVEVAITGHCKIHYHRSVQYNRAETLVDHFAPQAYFGTFRESPETTLSEMESEWSWAGKKLSPICQAYRSGITNHDGRALPYTAPKDLRLFLRQSLERYGSVSVWRWELMGPEHRAITAEVVNARLEVSAAAQSTPVRHARTRKGWEGMNYMLLALVWALATALWYYTDPQAKSWQRRGKAIKVNCAALCLFLVVLGIAAYRGANTPAIQENAADTNSLPSVAGLTVVIDPGHGGNDPGCIWKESFGTYYEASINYLMAGDLKRQLEGAGARVILTTRSALLDEYDQPSAQELLPKPDDAVFTGGPLEGQKVRAGSSGLKSRCDVARAAFSSVGGGKICFVSLHVDAEKRITHGAHVCVPREGRDSILARNIIAELEKRGWTWDSAAIRQQKLYVLSHHNPIPDRILVETGIPKAGSHDSWLLRNPADRHRLVAAIATGIAETYR